jgi:RNA polymerase sigma factor (sigma-70 family)
VFGRDEPSRVGAGRAPDAAPPRIDWAGAPDLRPLLPAARRLARRVLGADDLADDAVQEALIALLRAVAPPLDVRRWLHRAVLHRCLHLRRTSRRRACHEGRAAVEWRGTCPIEGPAQHLERSRLRGAIREALATLPPEWCKAFLLRELHGVDYQSIAGALDVPVGTVRSRLHRARHALRARLHHFGPTASRGVPAVARARCRDRRDRLRPARGELTRAERHHEVRPTRRRRRWRR